MKTHNLINQKMTGFLLVGLLLLTRSGIVGSHFGSSLNPPDASWAVFWLMGALVVGRQWLIALFIGCITADLIAVTNGIGTECFTAAYVFLLPAYLSLWAAGQWFSKQNLPATYSWVAGIFSVMLGVTTCFAVSNLGIFLTSSSTSNLSLFGYSKAVAQYLPLYLMTTCMYVVIAYCGIYATGRLSTLLTQHQKV